MQLYVRANSRTRVGIEQFAACNPEQCGDDPDAEAAEDPDDSLRGAGQECARRLSVVPEQQDGGAIATSNTAITRYNVCEDRRVAHPHRTMPQAGYRRAD